MTLLETLEGLLGGWRSAFRREKSFVRIKEVLIGLICAQGRRTITSSIRERGIRGDWSADYLVFSRAPWHPRELFRSALVEASKIHAELSGAGDPLVVHIDDTSTPKSGRSRFVRWMKDPLSPAFHVNLRRGLRFVHLAVDLPLYRLGFPARAVSVAFDLVPALQKPGKRATEEQIAEYKQLKKTHTLGHAAVERLRVVLDQLTECGWDRPVLLVGDGGYTNRHVLRNLPEAAHYLGRTRKDLALFAPAKPTGRRIYGERLPTPEQIRQDESAPHQAMRAHFGGTEREIRVKEVRDVLWRRGAGVRRLRLIIIAPTSYQGPKKKLYRDPAYLLTTDLDSPLDRLVQSYFDRWQIEVVHRECKDTSGVGQAQVRSDRAVERLYSAHVAMLSLLVIAAYRAFGPGRTEDFEPLPPWRSASPTQRPSYADLAQRLRADVERRRAASSGSGGSPPTEPDPGEPPEALATAA